MFYLLVVLVKMSVLAKWLARKTPLRKPNRGEWIVSTKPRLKSVYDFLGLVHCFIILWCLSWPRPYVIYTYTFHTSVAWYSLFVVKMPLHSNQLTNQFAVHFYWPSLMNNLFQQQCSSTDVITVWWNSTACCSVWFSFWLIFLVLVLVAVFEIFFSFSFVLVFIIF